MCRAAPPAHGRRCSREALQYGCSESAQSTSETIRQFPNFLQISTIYRWSRGDSNPCPPPCKVRILSTLVFATVRKCLQNYGFTSGSIRVCSPLFAWVVVLLAYRNFVQHQDSRAQHKRWCHACWKWSSQMPIPLGRARSRHCLSCFLLYDSPLPILSVVY